MMADPVLNWLQACPAAGAPDEIPLHRVQLTLCEPCIDGEGEECHTPGCDLFLHAVDIPILPAREQIADKRGGSHV